MEGTVVSMSDGGEFMPTNDSPVYTWSEPSEAFSLVVTEGEIYLSSIWFDDGSLPPQGIPEPTNNFIDVFGINWLSCISQKI